MNKKTRLKLNETLNKALEPPKKKDLSKLDELLNPYDVPEKPRLEVVAKITTGTTGTTDKIGTTGTINTTGTTRQLTSPEKDFTKTPNSVVRVALAQGLFRGKSKQIYDFLWSASRGAINPMRKVRKTFNEIQKGSGLGSRNTVMSGINHLESINLIIREVAVGESAGNSYEIFTPEELGYMYGSTSSTSSTETTQKVVVPVVPLFGTTGTTQTIENKDIYSDPKTSFKDIEENDDEACAVMLKVLSDASKKIAGKKSGAEQKENWKELAELLVMELEIAAARTKSVSNVPAFLTEHLRRRLLGNSNKSKFKASKSNKSLQIDVPDINNAEQTELYQAEPLSKEGRETVLATMKEYLSKGQSEFIMSFQETYTKNDWNWLMDELKNKKFA